ncbi:hypothetical protein ACP70R_048551 [Stipagrostis hirtigluma subsp. patula]
MYRTPLPRPRADGGAGMLNHAASRLPFPQFAQGRIDPEARRSEDEAAAWSSLRQMPQGFQQPEPRRGEGIISDVAGFGLMQRPGVHALGLDGGMSQQQFSQEEEVAHDSSTEVLWVQTSGSYFTDLLGSEVQESQDLSPTTGTPIDQGHAAAKGSQGRTKNFRDEEDRLLVSACWRILKDNLKISDPINTRQLKFDNQLYKTCEPAPKNLWSEVDNRLIKRSTKNQSKQNLLLVYKKQLARIEDNKIMIEFKQTSSHNIEKLTRCLHVISSSTRSPAMPPRDQQLHAITGDLDQQANATSSPGRRQRSHVRTPGHGILSPFSFYDGGVEVALGPRRGFVREIRESTDVAVFEYGESKIWRGCWFPQCSRTLSIFYREEHGSGLEEEEIPHVVFSLGRA